MSKRKSHSILERNEPQKLLVGLTAAAPSEPNLLNSEIFERDSASKDLPTINERKRRGKVKRKTDTATASESEASKKQMVEQPKTVKPEQ